MPKNYELDEPSQDLKNDFRDIVVENVFEDKRGFSHPDGRVFTLFLPSIKAGEIDAEEVDRYERSYSILIEEEVQNQRGELIEQDTTYHLDVLTGEVSKHIVAWDGGQNPFQPKELTAAEQIEIDRIEAARGDLEKGLGSRGYAKDVIDDVVGAEIRNRKRANAILTLAMERGLQEHEEARQDDEEHGLNWVGGSELQTLLDDVQIALQNPTS